MSSSLQVTLSFIISVTVDFGAAAGKWTPVGGRASYHPERNKKILHFMHTDRASALWATMFLTATQLAFVFAQNITV